MDVSCCSILDLTAVFPVPRPAWKPCSPSCNVMATASRQLRRLVTAFKRHSTRPIPLQSLLAPLIIRTTVYHVLSLTRFPLWNMTELWRQPSASWWHQVCHPVWPHETTGRGVTLAFLTVHLIGSGKACAPPIWYPSPLVWNSASQEIRYIK